MINQLPPQAPDMEKAVLGAILFDREALEQVESLLSPSDFYIPAHEWIFQAVLHLSHKNHPVDLLTVYEELTRMKKLDECGGPAYLAQLTSSVGSTTHAEYHALVVKEKAHARKLIKLAGELTAQAYLPENDIYEVQEKFEQQFTNLLINSSSTEVWDMPQTLKETVKHATELEELHKSGQHTAIPTGLPELDKALDGGWRAPDLIIVGGRPSMGKTQFGLWFARVAAEYGKQVLIISTEMSNIQLGERYILEDTRIDTAHFRTGKMDTTEWDAVDEKVGELWNLPIQFASDHTINQLPAIRAQARRLKRKGELDMLVVDYLGMIKTGLRHESRQHEIGEITAGLKNLAKELNIPVILISQLNRPAKGFSGRPPLLEDLRDSGNIEQDADIVVFVHRPGFYDTEAEDKNGISWKGRGQLLLSKQRQGARAITIVYHHDERYKKIW